MNDIAAARLRSLFRSVCDSGVVGAPAQLARLDAGARQCLASSDRQQRAVAYALSQFLRSAQADKEERQISASEMDAFTSEVTGPISNAVEIIADGGPADRAVAVIAEIAELHRRVLPD